MSIRQAARRAAAVLGAVSAAGAFSIAVLGAPAGAATPTSGSSVPNSAVPVGTVTAGAPFSSGQQINIVVPASSVFSPTANLNIEECAAPNGVIPTLPSACDGNTIQGPSLKTNSDGSINFQTETHSLYTIYALPDVQQLGESPGGNPACGDTAATECILYIGQDQNDFTQPHVWSQPFFILQNTNDPGDNGSLPGDGTGTQPPVATPEVPLAILLPGAALALLAGTVVIRRRRQQQLAHGIDNE